MQVERKKLHQPAKQRSSSKDFWSVSQKVNQKSNPRAKDHSERATERLGSSRYSCHRENYRQCTPPPRPPCTLTSEGSIFEEKACWSSFDVCHKTFGQPCELLGEYSLVRRDKCYFFLAIIPHAMFGGEMALRMTLKIPYQQWSLEVEASWYGAVFLLMVLAESMFWREDEWSHVPGNSWGESVTIRQDDEDETWMDIPAGQWSKTYCKGDSELVPEEENKAVGMAQSITRLKPNREFMEGTEDQDSQEGPAEHSRFEDILFRRMDQNPTCALWTISLFIQEASWSCYCKQRLFHQVLSIISVSVFNTFSCVISLYYTTLWL